MKKQTKQILAILVVLILLLVGIFAAFRVVDNMQTQEERSVSATSFARDIGDFVSANSGQVPATWEQFLEWDAKQQNSLNWSKEELESMFELQPYPDRMLGDVPRYIKVIDPDLYDSEWHVNAQIHEARIDLEYEKRRPRPISQDNPSTNQVEAGE